MDGVDSAVGARRYVLITPPALATAAAASTPADGSILSLPLGGPPLLSRSGIRSGALESFSWYDATDMALTSIAPDSPTSLPGPRCCWNLLITRRYFSSRSSFFFASSEA
jgi:hypothetical protein